MRKGRFEKLNKWQKEHNCSDEKLSEAIGREKKWLTRVKESNCKIKIKDLESVSRYTGINVFDLNKEFKVQCSYVLLKYKKGKGFDPVRLLTTNGAENFAKSCGFNTIYGYLYNLDKKKLFGKYEVIENFD